MRKNINECGVVLINKSFDNVLIIYQNESLKWGLPKGHMETNELKNKLYFDCAKRELLEETGIMITTHRYRKLGTFLMRDKLFYVIHLLKDINIRKPYDCKEIGAIKWLPIIQVSNFLQKYKCNITLKELCGNILTIYESHHKISSV